MASAPSRRLQQLSEQLTVPPADAAAVDSIPKVQQVAPDSTGQ